MAFGSFVRARGGGKSQAPVAVAIRLLIESGHQVEPADRVPGLYVVDGRELTTNQLIDLALRGKGVRHA